jgi:hypothetical protein
MVPEDGPPFKPLESWRGRGLKLEDNRGVVFDDDGL